jgi:hypothetical protein
MKLTIFTLSNSGMTSDILYTVVSNNKMTFNNDRNICKTYFIDRRSKIKVIKLKDVVQTFQPSVFKSKNRYHISCINNIGRFTGFTVLIGEEGSIEPNRNILET